MSKNLENKKVIVLGGTSGIGLATAIAAADQGAVVTVVSSNQGNVNNALKELPINTPGYAINLTNQTAIKNFFEQVGYFDHLIYTAGEKLLFGKLNSLNSNDIQEAFQVRYFGAVNAVKYGSKYILPGGSIVLTSGIAASRPQSGWTVGASICGAMESLTRSLAVELAPIRVNAVSPGFVKTNLWSDMDGEEREAMYQHVAKSLPLQRVGKADDIAQTYLYLMQEGFSTGQIITVDGGALLV